jgi:hypothetical protein
MNTLQSLRLLLASRDDDRCILHFARENWFYVGAYAFHNTLLLFTHPHAPQEIAGLVSRSSLHVLISKDLTVRLLRPVDSSISFPQTSPNAIDAFDDV